MSFMLFIGLFAAVSCAGLFLTAFLPARGKPLAVLVTVLVNAVVTSIPAVYALAGHESLFVVQGSWLAGAVPLGMDALSGWFVLLVNFTLTTGACYGVHYLGGAARSDSGRITLQGVSYLMVHVSLLAVLMVQNGLAFLIAWEFLAVFTFLLILFDSQKPATLKAGLNYLIQSHVSVLFLIFAFLWVAVKEGSFGFDAISSFTSRQSLITGMGLFLCFFAGFAVKAGLVPFHTWLPHAHPAAPAHVSGIMSGVVIKMGIYGMMRMLLLIHLDYTSAGWILMAFGVFSSLYGVILALLQHDLKRLLAYHSIENMGIITMGVGLGCIGLGTDNGLIAALGFSGALLHSLNHSLFKSLLFYGAGNIYKAAHSVHLDHLGGLGKRMPHTSLLFLAGALAICGLPPFNGFVSEFLLYKGMFSGLEESALYSLWALIFCVFALVLTGGLAVLCFTKAYGMVFLGVPRKNTGVVPAEAGLFARIPMYAILVFMMAIGLFPGVFVKALYAPVDLFLNKSVVPSGGVLDLLPLTLSSVGAASLLFVALAGMIYWLRHRCVRNSAREVGPTWACGYAVPTPAMQYTASSFVRSFRKLASPMLLIHKLKSEVRGVFPMQVSHHTEPSDKMEYWLIDRPLALWHRFVNRFTFLQHGSLQGYILYGILFIACILIFPAVYNKLADFLDFLKRI